MPKQLWVVAIAACVAVACKSQHEHSETTIEVVEKPASPPPAPAHDDPATRCANGDQDACASLSRDAAQITKLCDGGSPAACNTLGVLKAQANDLAAATALWTKTCAAKNGVGCFDLGIAAQTGTKDATKALGYFRQACDVGHARGCQVAGQLLGDGDGVKQDVPAATQLLVKGCAGGADDACRMLGNAAKLLADHPDALAEPVWRQMCELYVAEGCFAVKQYERACQLHDKRGCLAAIEPLLAAKKTEAARPFLEEACRLDDKHACTTGCELGDPLACEYAGDAKRALALRVKGCDANDAKSCFDLGFAYHEGKGVAKDHAKADALEQKACAASLLDACFDLAERKAKGLDRPKDVAGGAADYDALCKRGYGSACYAIAWMREHGEGVAKDVALATQLFSEGCDKDSDASSCFEAARLTRSSNKPGAIDKLRHGCRLGEQRQCDQLASLGIHERPDPSHHTVFESH